jgi:DNA-binding Lrp family transcriptional regulator
VGEHVGLFTNAKFVLATLMQHGPLTVSELARARGLHRNTVRALLGKLEKAGLAADINGKWTALVTMKTLVPTLDAVAQVMGVAGAGERQWLRHLRQRACYRARTLADGLVALPESDDDWMRRQAA